MPSRNPLPVISTRASAVSSRTGATSITAASRGVTPSTAATRGVTPSTAVTSRDSKPSIQSNDKPKDNKVGGVDMDDFLPVSARGCFGIFLVLFVLSHRMDQKI